MAQAAVSGGSEMSIENVKAYFKGYGIDERILEFDVSSATVELAAEALHCEPKRIAKTLSFLVDGHAVLVVAAGDAKIDNPKYKAQFGTKAKMLSPQQVEELVGHAVGGVCPFAVHEDADVYLDVSLKRYFLPVEVLTARLNLPSLRWSGIRDILDGWTSVKDIKEECIILLQKTNN